MTALLWIVLLLCFASGRLAAWLRPRRMYLGTPSSTLDVLGLLGTLGFALVLVMFLGTFAFGWDVPLPWQVASASYADGTPVPYDAVMQSPISRDVSLLVCAFWTWVGGWIASAALGKATGIGASHQR